MDWTQRDLDRFWSKIKKTQGCWIWQGSVGSHGYGRFTRGRQWEETAHRIAYAMSHGPIPKGLVVRHACDNRLCCNPAHLSAGTQAQNVQDAVIRSKLNQLLTLDQVLEIRERLAGVPKGARTGIGLALAEEYGVTPSTISVIKHNKRWKEDYHRGS